MPDLLKKYIKIVKSEKETKMIQFTHRHFLAQDVKNEFNKLATIPLNILQIKNAYGVNNIPKINNTELGTGINIAVIIAGTYTNAQNDLNFYCDFYKLPRKQLVIVKMSGATSQGWEIEGALDLQCAYTMALGANIYLVQARSASFQDIMNAIDWCNKNRIDVINMSFGAGEFLTQSSFKKYFTNTNILYCAASGDTSSIPNFPSVLANVLSIGGTTLSVNNNNLRTTETTWGQGGCTASKYEFKPSYQNNIDDLTKNLKYRNTPDISANANPSSGVKIYCNNVWYSVGGTSASCPLMCGVLAIVCYKRKLLNKSKLNTISNNNNDIHKYLYDLSKINTYSKYFYDVITGNNGKNVANVNYDIPTGLGVLKADAIVEYLSKI